ncbi:TPA: hypothetical protein ACX96U_002977 [Clostridium sporogenes]
MEYKMKIGIRYPIANKEIDFTEKDKKEAIEEAVEIFNGSNNNKSITNYEISKKYIDIWFQCSKPIARPLRELSSFSRNLYSTLGEYSSVEGKLFKAISINEINSEINDEMNISSDEYISDEELIDALKFLLRFKNVGNATNKEKKNTAIRRIKEIIHDIL